MDDKDDRSGSELGPYRLERLLGRGGMGVVYEANDTRLGRTVALKILRPEVVQDPERRARFEREAKALAALKHPGIVTIHSFETIGEDTFFTMELVAGRTLDTVMRAEGAMPVSRILEIAIPVADALAAAHHKGIAHRDVKPENIIIDERGRITVLDFGLAKLATSVFEEPDDGTGATASMDVTVEGRIIGTIHYMAPEQAQGAETTPTTDVFSLGVILYEMATGTSPFPGDTTVSKLSSIIKDDPRPIGEHNEALPPELERLIRRCLVKLPDRRWQTAIDVRNELEILRDELRAPSAVSSAPASSSDASRSQVQPQGMGGKAFVMISMLVSFALLFGFGVGMFLMNIGEEGGMGGSVSAPIEETSRCFSITGPSGYEIMTSTISPDASRLALITQKDISDDRAVEDYVPGDRFFLHIRNMDSFETTLVGNSQRIVCGRFSPDGLSYIFVTLPEDSKLPAKLMRLELGTDLPAVAIGTVPLGYIGRMEQIELGRGNRGFSWGDDGVLTFITDKPYEVVRIDAKNGDEISKVALDFRAKELLPNEVISSLGGGFVLASVSYYDERGFIQDVVWIDAATGGGGVVVEGSPYAEILHDSMVLFTKGATLYQAGYDPVERRMTGDVSPVFTGLRTLNSWSSGKFDVASNGTLVHLPGGLQGGKRSLWKHPLDGSPAPIGIPDRAFEDSIAVSAQGDRILLTNTNDTNAMWDIWAGTVDPPRLRRILSFPDRDIFAGILSGDGSIAAAQINTTHPTQRSDLVVFEPTSGSEPVVLETDEIRNFFPYDFHPLTGDLIYGLRDNMQETQALYQRPLDPEASPRLLLGGKAFNANASLSPDGRMIAFTSNASGIAEAFVSRYDAGALVGRVIPVSNGQADDLFWARDPEGDGLSIRYFTNGVEHARDVALQGSGLQLGPVRITGRRLDPDAVSVALDLNGQIFSIRKGSNEAPAQRVEVITGRFNGET